MKTDVMLSNTVVTETDWNTFINKFNEGSIIRSLRLGDCTLVGNTTLCIIGYEADTVLEMNL